MLTREALLQDAPRIAEIHAASWQTAFRGIMPDEFLNRQNVQDIAAGWLKNIQEYPGNLWVVENKEQKITGFACNGRKINKTQFPAYEGQIFGIACRSHRQTAGLRALPNGSGISAA